jgi:hypothetical protein
MGYGPLNLNPEQLGLLTYSEFNELLAGYNWRERREMERLSILAAWVIQPHVDKEISPEDLLPGEKKKRKVTQEEKEEVTREIEKRLGVI